MPTNCRVFEGPRRIYKARLCRQTQPLRLQLHHPRLRHLRPSRPLPLPLPPFLLDGFASPNSMTFPSILKSCSASIEARQIHGQILKRNLQTDPYTQNALIHVYIRIGSLSDSLLVFDRMADRDVVSWNTVLVGMADAGLVGEAREIFDDMPEKDVVSWSCMIDGQPNSPLMIDICLKNSRFEEVLNLFNEMLRLKIKPNNFTLVAALTSCTRIAALEQGEWIHYYIKKHHITLDAVLGTALLKMYSKCGSLDKALNVFEEMQERDIGSWNSVISSLAIHGRGKEALHVFSRLLETSTRPDDITFLSVLSACRHSGLVDEGRRFFYLMNDSYSFKPTPQHFGCMVDLLCRAGLLDEAKELIESNKGMEFSVPTWGLCSRPRLGVEISVWESMLVSISLS